MKSFFYKSAALFLAVYLFSCGRFDKTSWGNNDYNDKMVNITDQIGLETWTWMSGSDMNNDAGKYGELGQESVDFVPAARHSSAVWKDKQGKFWLFGGALSANAGNVLMNDIWKFDPKTYRWAWTKGSQSSNQQGIYGIKGQYSMVNRPGSRFKSSSWCDKDGNFWLFGGIGCDKNGSTSFLNDLWKYDSNINQWAFISGSEEIGGYGDYSSNYHPGARKDAVSLTDSDGNFWLFGGLGLDDGTNSNSSFLNDLWRYEPSIGKWTWISGSSSGNRPSSNVPGSRFGSVGWIDSDNNIYIFAGYQYDGSEYAYMNDFWKYDPVRKQWTRIFEHTKELLRDNAVTWTDRENCLWIYGGSNYYNDVWKFDPVNLEWSEQFAQVAFYDNGSYISKRKPDKSNRPRNRYSSVSWIDDDGYVWFFGGISEGYSILNDMWRYVPSDL